MSHSRLTLVHRADSDIVEIPFSEKQEDHTAILNAYKDTHVTRNHSSNTIDPEFKFITDWFTRYKVADSSHPDKERQLFVWEAMEPVLGRQRIIEFVKSLLSLGLKSKTVAGYVGYLRRLFTYVLEWPYIPGPVVQSVSVKYGQIEQPVLYYDYPVHAVEIEPEGVPLTGDDLLAFYDYIRLDYIPRMRKRWVAERDYSMIVLTGETGLRAREVRFLDLFGQHRDLFFKEQCIQTRYGKGTKGSGPRPRKTVFPALARDTLSVYIESTRPQFLGAATNPALFLAENGNRISYGAMITNLRNIEKAAREAGFDLPPNFGWHNLRKSFATNYLNRNPGELWTLMNLMGHSNPGCLSRYVINGKAILNQKVQRVFQALLPAHNDSPGEE